MTRHMRSVLAIAAAILFVPAMSQTAKGTPQISGGMHCAACHFEASPDVLTINGDLLAGGLETFQIEPGETVQFSFDVTEQAGVFEEFEYILGVNGLELSGLSPLLNSTWEHRSADLISYVLDDDYERSRRFTLDVKVDEAMPPGDYFLLAVVAGEGETILASGQKSEVKWFDSSPFKLQVASAAVPEPTTVGLLLTFAASFAGLRRRRTK